MRVVALAVPNVEASVLVRLPPVSTTDLGELSVYTEEEDVDGREPAPVMVWSSDDDDPDADESDMSVEGDDASDIDDVDTRTIVWF